MAPFLQGRRWVSRSIISSCDSRSTLILRHRDSEKKLGEFRIGLGEQPLPNAETSRQLRSQILVKILVASCKAL